MILIYVGLIVYTTLNLAYPKEHVYNTLYDIIVLEPSMSFYYITWLCDYNCDMCHASIMLCGLCDIISHPLPKSKIRKVKVKTKDKIKKK